MKGLMFVPFLLFSISLFAQESTISIEIKNLESTKGFVYVSVFTDQKSFADEKPLKRLTFAKDKHMSGSTFKATITLPPGTYGLALLDDDNSDGEMNYNWVGMPTEGFGFSDYYHTSLTRPVFSDFSFSLTKSPKTVKVKMRYL